MKVSNAKICLNCDEIYEDEKNDQCPKCTERHGVMLKDYFKPMRNPVEINKKALEVENGKYNARDSEADHEIRKKPMPGEMQAMGSILNSVMKGAMA